MAADEDIVVEIEAPAPETTIEDKTKITTKAAPDPVAELKAQYDELQAESARQKQAREAAERRASEAERGRQAAEAEVQTSRTEVVESRMQSVDTGLAAAQTEAAAAKAALQAAQEAGDFKAVGDATERLADARAQMAQWNQAKNDLEVAKTQRAETRQDARQDTRTQPTDPVEAFISGPIDAAGRRRSDEAQNWLRNHKTYITDERKRFKLNAAHNDALAEEIEPDSEAYFAHVEKFLGLTKETKTATGNGKTRGKSAPVAPVNTTAGETTGGGSVVRLSKNEAAAATDGTLQWNYDDPTGQKRWKKGDPIGIQEMARRKQAMTEEGHYDPMNFIQQ